MSEKITYWDFEESPWQPEALTLADVPDDPGKLYVVEHWRSGLVVRKRVRGEIRDSQWMLSEGFLVDYRIIQGVGFDVPQRVPKTLAEVPERRLCRIEGLSAVYWHSAETVYLIRSDRTLSECRDQWHMYQKHRVETVLPFVAVLKTKGVAK